MTILVFEDYFDDIETDMPKVKLKEIKGNSLIVELDSGYPHL